MINKIFNKKILLGFTLISSVALPNLGSATEDFALSTSHLHIRTLAASCAACHGTNGNAVGASVILAGMEKQYFITQMLAFKNGERPATVMHRHAKGLQADEINLLAEYFAAQKPLASISPKTQTLKVGHD